MLYMVTHLFSTPENAKVISMIFLLGFLLGPPILCSIIGAINN